jgi:hypothetical protein
LIGVCPLRSKVVIWSLYDDLSWLPLYRAFADYRSRDLYLGTYRQLLTPLALVRGRQTVAGVFSVRTRSQRLTKSRSGFVNLDALPDIVKTSIDTPLVDGLSGHCCGEQAKFGRPRCGKSSRSWPAVRKLLTNDIISKSWSDEGATDYYIH